MGAQTGLLVALVVTLLWTCAQAHGAGTCSGFRHLENGRTFFRYGGLLVIFRCNPGYKLYGHHTSSCASGRWSRDPPVCVGLGCPSPGRVIHGTSSVTADGSWVSFSCDTGFRLHGSSMLYCKGPAWNSSTPVCKESDIMSLVSHLAMEQSDTLQAIQSLQAPSALNNHIRSHYATLLDTAWKEAFLKAGLFSYMPSQTPKSSRVQVSELVNGGEPRVQHHNPEVLPQDGAHPTAGIQKGNGVHVTISGRNFSKAKHSHAEVSEEVGGVTEASSKPLDASSQITRESYLLATMSPTLSSLSRTDLASSLTGFQTSAVGATVSPAIRRSSTAQTVPVPPTPASTSSAFGIAKGKESIPVSNAPQNNVTGDRNHEADTVLHPLPAGRGRHGGSGVGSPGVEELNPDQTEAELPDVSVATQKRTQLEQAALLHVVSTSTFPDSKRPLLAHPSPVSPSPTFSSSSSTTHSPPISLLTLSSFTTPDRSSSQSKAVAPLYEVTSPGFTLTPGEPRPYWMENHTGSTVATADPATPSLTLGGQRPVCPDPPVPVHGTFYFQKEENPGPGELPYILYACDPGYMLADGDTPRYCQHGGTWSGVTPVCLELSPCSVNNGGCAQLCTESQSHNETRARTRCHCRRGFALLDDEQTCRDVDECVEEQHHCQQGCINTFGSFKCSCDHGYRLSQDQTSCADVDECQLPVAVTGCVFGCINTPGGFYCGCPAGYSLQAADGNCQDIDECADNQGRGPCREQCHNSPGSYRCSCGFGHTLAGDGRSCIPECPPGYRKRALASTPDNSAELALKGECIDVDECEEEARQLARCDWQCVNLPGSHRCICPRGYTLQGDGRRCKDINECGRKNGGCSHLCVNHKGGYKCACPASHRPSPYSWKKCVPGTTEHAAG